ncbi:MAG: alpha-hydroxy acid oxidase [Candidatus Nanopelagicales bacterium]
MTDAPAHLPALTEIVSIKQLEPLAAALLAGPTWDYVCGGAGDERTLAANQDRWSDIQLAPRTLVDVSRLDTSTDLLGLTLEHPIMLAPTARHTAYHPGGELETIRGARAAQALYVQSSLGGMTLDPVGELAAELDQPWWFQLYVQRDRGWTLELVNRAIAAGASALVLTVDTPTLGARDRDKRNNLGAATGVTYPILDGAPVSPDDTPAHRRVYNPHLSPDITWKDLEWLVSQSPVPILPKGVLRPDDARRAVELGVGGVIVSNHGARNLDSVPATVDALPGVASAVAGDVPVLVDGGIRRGTDVTKALCLGATAVLVGRPYIWGLTAYGAPGVTHVVEILRTECEMAMALLGAPTIADLTADLLWPPD